MEIVNDIREAIPGGALSPVVVIAAVVLILLALRTAQLLLKLVLLALAAASFAGVAPWAGNPITSEAADCAAAAVNDAASGWRALAAQRVTVESVSGDARCAPSHEGLTAGSATVTLRTFFDLPVQTWTVSATGVSG